MRPDGGARRRVATTVASVDSVAALTPRMTRVRLAGEGLRGLAAVPGQTVKIHVPDPHSGAPVSRDYTVRDFCAGQAGPSMDASAGPRMDASAGPRMDASAGPRMDASAGPRMDIDFVLHGDGPAATWARRVRPGERLEFVGPSGRYRPDPDADWHLFAGDETALPAIAAYVEMLPATARIEVYLEIADAGEQQPLHGPDALTVHWLHRGAAEPGTSTVLEDALRAVELPAGQGRVWIAGHTPTVRRIRAHLLGERGVDRRALYVKGFWDRAGRAP